MNFPQFIALHSLLSSLVLRFFQLLKLVRAAFGKLTLMNLLDFLTGNYRLSPRYNRLRHKIYKRDHYRCTKCGASNTKLEMHHIRSWDKYPRLRFVEHNCITLCHKCHMDILVSLWVTETYSYWSPNAR